MKLIGCMLVRNEDWCLGLSLRVALTWCDEVVVLDHASTDTSRWIVDAIASEDREHDRIARCVVTDSVWNEMANRQAMLDVARREAATHIALIDADEILIPGTDLAKLPRQGQLLMLPGYNLRNGISEYHANGIWGERWFATAFQDEPGLSWAGDGHHHRQPFGRDFVSYKPVQQGEGGVMHLWGASEKRLRAKHALYKVSERLKFPNKNPQWIEKEYNLWRSPEDAKIAYPTVTLFHQPWTFNPVPQAWWEPYKDWMQYLDVDRDPWQIAEVQRLVREHGREKFQGLDLFGIA